MLRARSRVDGDASDQELRIVADEKLRDRGDTDDHVAGSENHRAFEEAGDQAVDHLKPLADEIGNCRKRAELKQAKAKLLHHHRKDDRSDTVLKMIQRVTGADQTQSETSLPKTGFESRRVGGHGCSCSDGSCWIIHDGLTRRSVGIMECWIGLQLRAA